VSWLTACHWLAEVRELASKERCHKCWQSMLSRSSCLSSTLPHHCACHESLGSTQRTALAVHASTLCAVLLVHWRCAFTGRCAPCVHWRCAFTVGAAWHCATRSAPGFKASGCRAGLTSTPRSAALPPINAHTSPHQCCYATQPRPYVNPLHQAVLLRHSAVRLAGSLCSSAGGPLERDRGQVPAEAVPRLCVPPDSATGARGGGRPAHGLGPCGGDAEQGARAWVGYGTGCALVGGTGQGK